jgi:predicted transport protein
MEAMLAKGSPESLELFNQVHEHLLSLDEAIDVVPKKLYIAYKLARNLVCVEIQQKKVVVTLNRKAYSGMPDAFVDVTSVGHWGTGDIQVHITQMQDLAAAIEGISETYKLAGGN